ncbi:uncharacterized protein LOC131224931 [Magnolia sinica]|uniref:uncharacterized protein LOC131224931 n=1 Tax=Magnolia sinica TaxID=86752 RepID=UPI00265839AB|nr:uncharacterized protein LOC131224931 [Magnolia sinica]
MAELDFVWTWEEFVVCFDQKFFPKHIREQRALEFETLVQGEMMVSQYEARFIVLSRFASYIIDDEKRKARRFVSGLLPVLRSRGVGHLLTTFDEVVHRALVYEEDWAMSYRSGEQSSSGDRKRKAPSGSSHNLGIVGASVLISKSSREHRSCPCPILHSSSSSSSDPSIKLLFIGLLPSSKGSSVGHHNGRSSSRDRGRGDRFYAAQQEPQSSYGGVVEGILLISSCVARVLFDSGASHSFVVEEFCRTTSLPSKSAPKALSVSTPLEKFGVLSHHCLLVQFWFEIPGLPSHRQIKFQINLVLGTVPISKAPYQMAQLEL